MNRQELRTHILERAQDQFTQFGFSRVTMDDLARQLGISKKTLYKEFRSKEDLLRNVVQVLMQRLEQEIGRIIFSQQPFIQKFTSFLTLAAGVLTKFSRQLQTDMERKAPGIWREIEAFRETQINEKLNRLFQQGMQEGFIRRDIQYDVFLLMVLLCVQGIVNPQVLSTRPFSAQEAARSVFTILFEGVLTPDARRSLQLSDIFQFKTL